jgi:hypothetical protein
MVSPSSNGFQSPGVLLEERREEEAQAQDITAEI